MRPTRLALILTLAAGAALGGCLTKRERPHLSQAVLEARARAKTPLVAGCPATALSDISPVMVGFAFDDAALPPLEGHPIVGAVAWLLCHPATPVVIKPDADTHGTAAEQDALARRRAEAVLAYLVANKVEPGRIRILPRSGAEPAGEHLVVLAEGRRW